MNNTPDFNYGQSAWEDNKSLKNDFFVIGIGASAGGLDAIRELFKIVQSDSVSYVVVQHRATDQTSILAGFLNRESALSIQEATDGLPVEVNKVYLQPAGKQIQIINNRLSLTDRPAEEITLRTLDLFFESLAAAKGKKAIGIILSGTGTDGLAGIAAIKKAGGLVLVQDPKTAKFDSLPRNAINSGNVDFVLPIELMPDEIFNFVKVAPLSHQITEFVDNHHEEILNEILEIVHQRTGLDFINYKRPTIIRRLSRRMVVTNVTNLVDYLDYLHLHPEEVEIISKEFLIGVTQFFRDPEAFEFIQQNVIPDLIARKNKIGQLRIWVPACSTGEEAYSLAIIIRECLDLLNQELEVKIFASDIDEEALTFAGKGIYSYNSIKDISEDRLVKFFVTEEGKYRVCQRIRKMVIFAAHNIINNPPFSKMDLISCRNMLIYFNPVLQKKIISKFRYALVETGYLFLGSSENLGEDNKLIEVNKKWKIFRNIGPTRAMSLDNYSEKPIQKQVSPALQVYSRSISPKVAMNLNAVEALNETIMEEYGYAAVYVDENFDVLHGSGDYNKFLTLPDKMLTMNLLKMVPPELAVNLGSMLRRVLRDKEKLTMHGLPVRDNDKIRRINVVIKPFVEDSKLVQKFILLLFSEEKPVDPGTLHPESFPFDNQNDSRIAELELELQHTRDDLQAVVEELETSNEELQSTNEELLSANEELQSTNEELQSLNEELHTINAEHQYKIKVLVELDDDLNNYFRSTNISQIFVDRSLEIRKYTPAATKQINLIESDIGRSIYQISNNLRYEGIIEDLRQVITNPVTLEKEVQDKNGTWYQMRIQPYITQEGKIDGAIIIFYNVNELKNLHLLHTGILDSSLNLIQAFKAVRDTENQIIDFEWTLVNTRAEEFLKRRESEIIGQRFRREFPGKLRNELFTTFVQVVNTSTPQEQEVKLENEGQLYWFHLMAVKLNDGLVLTLQNITDRKQAEQQLLQQAEEIRQSAEKFRRLFEAIPHMSWTSRPDGGNDSYNERWFEYTGLTFAELHNWDWVQTIHPDEAKEAKEDYFTAIQSGEVFEKEFRIRRHDGMYRWHLNLAVPIRNEEGNIFLWVGTATDIHEQKQIIQEMEENRHFIRQLSETSPDITYVFDLTEKKPIYVSRNLAQALGYPEDEFVGKKDFGFFQLMHPEDLPNLRKNLLNPVISDDPQYNEVMYRLKDAAGNWRWFRDRFTIFKYSPTNQPLQIMGVAQDVTNHVAIDQKLKNEKEFSESLLNNSIDGIVAFDTKACITAWNTMMEQISGKTRKEVLGKNIFELFPEYQVNQEGEAVRSALQGQKTILHDHPYGLREGTYESSTLPLTDDLGQVIGGLTIIHDITDRKRMEDERINLKLNQQKEIVYAILKAQEGERIRISEALHNGLGQLLYATKLKLTDLQPEAGYNLPLHQEIDNLLDEAIRETRNISFELTPSILKDFGLEVAIKEVCKRVTVSHMQMQCEVIGFTQRLDETLEVILFRITQELINNVIKHAHATEVSVQLLNQRNRIVLRVEDNGVGFNPDQLEDQTGLGINSIQNRLDLLNGKLDIESEPGKGAAFTVKIEKK